MSKLTISTHSSDRSQRTAVAVFENCKSCSRTRKMILSKLHPRDRAESTSTEASVSATSYVLLCPRLAPTLSELEHVKTNLHACRVNISLNSDASVIFALLCSLVGDKREMEI